MRHNFTSNRLNDYAQFYNPSTETDDYGRPTQVDVFSFDCRCNIDEKSGSQAESMGKTLTDSVITLLTYFHWSVNSGQVVRYNGSRYQVEHIQPDSVKHSMIVTCSLLGTQSFTLDQVIVTPTDPDIPEVTDVIRVGINLDNATEYEYYHNGRLHPRVWFIDSSGSEIEVDVNYGDGGIIKVDSAIVLHGTLYIE